MSIEENELENSGLAEEREPKNYSQKPQETPEQTVSKVPDEEQTEIIESEEVKEITPFIEHTENEEWAIPDEGNTPGASYTDEFEHETGDEQGLSATEQVGAAAGRSTSNFIWRNVKNGMPEVGAFASSIDDVIVDESKIAPELKLSLIEQINNYNKDNKQKFVVPEYIEQNIEEPLRLVLEKRGLEQEMPPELELAVGVGFLGLWFYMTQKDIKKTNRIYLFQMTNTIKAHEEKMEQLLKSQAETTSVKEVKIETQKK